jgi:hypothetical protein
MNEFELGFVIAKRQLELESDGKLLFVTVLMGAPQGSLRTAIRTFFVPYKSLASEMKRFGLLGVLTRFRLCNWACS